MVLPPLYVLPDILALTDLNLLTSDHEFFSIQRANAPISNDSGLVARLSYFLSLSSSSPIRFLTIAYFALKLAAIKEYRIGGKDRTNICMLQNRVWVIGEN